MLTVLEVTLPVFALVFCGWIAARRRLLSDEAADGINAFVFWFALPAMLYRVVSNQPLSQLADLRFALAYLAAAAAVFAFAWAAAGRSARDGAERTAWAFAATHGNIGYLGIPLLAQLGDASRMPPLLMAMMVDLFVVIVGVIILFEFTRAGTATHGAAARVRQAVGGLLRTPMILAIAVGLLGAVTALKLPAPVQSLVDLLAQAAPPCALFAIGASLGRRTVVPDSTASGLIVLKLVAHPALVALAMAAFGVEPALAVIGVLVSALPAASNVFILSQRYGVNTTPIGAAIVVGTFAAALTVSLVIWAVDLPIR